MQRHSSILTEARYLKRSRVDGPWDPADVGLIYKVLPVRRNLAIFRASIKGCGWMVQFEVFAHGAVARTRI